MVAAVAIAAVALVPMVGRDGSSTPGGSATSTATATDGATGSEPAPTNSPSAPPDLVIDDVEVRCGDMALATCENVASRGILQFARGGPGDLVLVRERDGCPAVPSFVDPAACWEVEAPRDEGAAPCIVIARRLDGVYAQVAGDAVSGLGTVPGSREPGCPPVPPLVALDPPAPPEELPGECMNHQATVLRVWPPLEERAHAADAVVIGTITEVGATRWSSADGRAPAGDGDGTGAITMFRIAVERVIAGNAPTTMTVWAPGGIIGCHSFSIDGVTRPTTGARDVFFLGESGSVAGVDGVVGMIERGAIINGSVRLQVEGSIPLETFIERAGDGS